MNTLKAPALLFDFFGTLVGYQPGRSQRRYQQTYEMALACGISCNQDSFVATWRQAAGVLERRSSETLREFSMTDEARAFAEASGVQLTDQQLSELSASFVEEWARHIAPIPGVTAMIERLSQTWSISIVSNTNDATMVPKLLDQIDISRFGSGVTLSVEHGWRKPHRSIYQVALDSVQCEAADAVFIGGSYEPDYVGPTQAGMKAVIIDPDRTHDVPDGHRVSSILDLEEALRNLS